MLFLVPFGSAITGSRKVEGRLMVRVPPSAAFGLTSLSLTALNGGHFS
jgi:hypothetical protein